MRYIIPFTITLLFFICSPSHAENTVRITNGEFPPLLSQNLKHYGLASRIVTEAFGAEGIKVEYGFFPWNRSFWLAQRGVWDGSAVWMANPERKKDFLISDTVIEGVIVFFHLRNLEFNWQDLKDLKKYTIGATIGYSYTNSFNQMAKSQQLKVEYVKSDIMNITKLLKGRIDLFPCEREVAFHIMRTQLRPEEIAKITFHPKSLKKTDYKLLLSKKSETNKYLLYFFNRGLKKLKNEGKIEKYIQQSNNGDYLLR